MTDAKISNGYGQTKKAGDWDEKKNLEYFSDSYTDILHLVLHASLCMGQVIQLIVAFLIREITRYSGNVRRL